MLPSVLAVTTTLSLGSAVLDFSVATACRHAIALVLPRSSGSTRYATRLFGRSPISGRPWRRPRLGPIDSASTRRAVLTSANASLRSAPLVSAGTTFAQIAVLASASRSAPTTIGMSGMLACAAFHALLSAAAISR